MTKLWFYRRLKGHEEPMGHTNIYMLQNVVYLILFLFFNLLVQLQTCLFTRMYA